MAKEKPGAIPFASTGIGSPPIWLRKCSTPPPACNSSTCLSRRRAGMTDLLGGQVQVVVLDMPVVISQIRAGALVPIGVAADKRDPTLPDVPTFAEQGYPNTDASSWYGLLAPAKTPPAVIAKLNKASTTRLPTLPSTRKWSMSARCRSAARRIRSALSLNPNTKSGERSSKTAASRIRGSEALWRHSGLPRSGKSGIHNPAQGVWIPGSSFHSAPE